MTTAIEIVAGLAIAGALTTVMTILAAHELGRAISQDEEQREVRTAGAGALHFRDAV